jgi:hypothetical protein
MADATYQPKVYRKQGGDELVVASGGLVTLESGGIINVESGGAITIAAGGLVAPVALRTSDEDTYSLTKEMSGLIYIGTKATATQVISLPLPTTLGVVFIFICGHAGGEINIDPGAATYTITGVAATKDLKNTAATNVIGDAVVLVSDGGINWYIQSVVGTWATT